MKFIKKIIIENFQSHEHSELDLDAGLNIIIGQSDKGKSAILRALKWVLFNEPRGTDFIRYGANECSVTIITGDDYTITRKRKSNKNIYIVINPGGEKLEFENFGNDVPLEVIDATGLKKIKLDTDTETKLNLNEQLDPPFLLSETGTVRAKAIGRIVNTNIIDAAERDILKDISNNNVTIKGLERQLSEIEEELLTFADIDIQEKNIQKIENLLEKLFNENSKSEKLKSFQTKIGEINQAINNNNALLEQSKNLSHISSYYNDLSLKTSNHQKLINYFNKLQTITSDIQKDLILLKKFEAIKIVDTTLKDIDAKASTLMKLKELQGNLEDTNAKITKGKQFLIDLKKDLTDKVSKYSQGLKQLGKCPTCYSIISDNALNHIICELEGETNGN